MCTHKKVVGVSLAAAVALVFAAAPLTIALANNNEIVTCLGANSCQGKSECRMTTTTCKIISEKGQNACKGLGLLKVSKVECFKRGGQGVVYTVPPNVATSLPASNVTVDSQETYVLSK